MLQGLVAGFCGGACASYHCSKCEPPRVGLSEDDSTTFRLSVQVLSASIPSLPAPGIFVRQRPRAEISLGSARKDTNLAEYVGCSRSCSSGAFSTVSGREMCGLGGLPTSAGGGRRSSSASAGAGAEALAGPWRFGDSVTLVARLEDLLGPGLGLRICTHGDVRVGPVQLQLAQVREHGKCVLDLRRRVLPACGYPWKPGAALDACYGAAISSPPVPFQGSCSDDSELHRMWLSPVLVVPLAAYPAGDSCRGDRNIDPVDVSAHLALAFGVSRDPEVLSRLADEAERSLTEKVAVPLRWAASGCSATCGRCASGDDGVARCAGEEAEVPEERERGAPSSALGGGSGARSAWSHLTDIDFAAGGAEAPGILWPPLSAPVEAGDRDAHSES
eukprot:TRINITY_DN27197_c0_g1_i1.p1 TRINITY_DN27197_c0_g1~~TRINITY_DN27197_c0_g1_i1.p1  ORF type:complete len:420 (-),score=78.97 TRINITY_DN27197_c0_g1_i1:62-1228(-)